jgi:hypothetical protein
MLNEDPTLFEYFQIWLYSKEILTNDKVQGDIPWRVLVDLFVFGDARGIPHLQKAAVDAIIKKQWDLNRISTRSIKYIYEETPEHSPLRRLFVESMANLGNASWFTEEEDWHRKHFLLNLAQAQFALSKGEKWSLWTLGIIARSTMSPRRS